MATLRRIKLHTVRCGTPGMILRTRKDMLLRGLIATAVTVAVVLYLFVRFSGPITPLRQPVHIAEGYHLTEDFKVGRESEYAVRLCEDSCRKGGDLGEATDD